MKKAFCILTSCLLLSVTWAVPISGYTDPARISFDFFGKTIDFQVQKEAIIDFQASLSENSILDFYNKISKADYRPVLQSLLDYKEKYRPDDWLYYQLIRKTAQQLSPKQENYARYTLYKWFLLLQSGYDAILSISTDKILFYVQSNENAYNIPSRIHNNKQYVCLNYHDYGSIDFNKYLFTPVVVSARGTAKPFTYRITQLPDFKPETYNEKDIHFTYFNHDYQFTVKLNPQVQSIFANYPVLDYAYAFNIPLSKETYSSLIPALRKNVKGLSTKNGVDYLMRFTRYAFMYKPDTENFGKEKRLTPEETLLYNNSDCEDRAALFFYLVKEIYNLPMIVLAYPEHVTVAVQFDKAAGEPILFNGGKYYVCEPTPQKEDLKIGQIIPSLAHTAYEVAYAYQPASKK